MKLLVVSLALLISPTLGLLSTQAQDPSPSRPGSASGEIRLPSGRLQRDVMAKADHERNLEETDALIKLAEELKSELEKNTEHVLSVAAMKKTEEIEKLAKRIRSRMKRY